MVSPILITSLTFIAIGLILTQNNAKYLLAGYNTMSEEERSKYNIKTIAHFTKRLFVTVGCLTLSIGLILNYTSTEKIVGLFLTFFPVAGVIYLLIEINRKKYKH